MRQMTRVLPAALIAAALGIAPAFAGGMGSSTPMFNFGSMQFPAGAAALSTSASAVSGGATSTNGSSAAAAVAGNVDHANATEAGDPFAASKNVSYGSAV